MISIKKKKKQHRYLVPFRVEASNPVPKHKAIIEIFSVLNDPGSSKGLIVLGILYLIVKGRYKKVHSTELITLSFMGEVGEETLVH